MQKHIKIYLESRNLSVADFIKCEECGAKAVDIHHIIPRSRASKEYVNDPKNLQALIVTGKQIGRASCRERVSSPV